MLAYYKLTAHPKMQKEYSVQLTVFPMDRIGSQLELNPNRINLLEGRKKLAYK
jgi:hypothetical protein